MRLFAVAACVAGAAFCAFAQDGAIGGADNPELERELYYVSGLRELRLYDYADSVLGKIKQRFPDAGPKLKAKELEGLLYQGKFDDVLAIIAKEKDQDSADTWAMKLSLADAYYAYAQYDKARSIYETFFKKFDKEIPAGIKSFYMSSAYRYAQMLIHLKEDKAALDVYKQRLIGKAKDLGMANQVQRQCKAEMCEIVLRLLDSGEFKDAKVREAQIKEADKWADGLLWDQDHWFGKGIVIKAHLLMLQGKPEGAKKLVDTYMPQLKSIHDGLADAEAETGDPYLRNSPMPECRFLLASMLQDEANKLLENEELSDEDREKVLADLIGDRKPNGQKGRISNGAYQHFINVFIQYPESSWAAEAGERAEQVRAVISERFGTELKAQVSAEQMSKVRKLQFQDANMLYAQGQLEEAINRYLIVLNNAPEFQESIGALGNLARAYYETAKPDNLNQLYGDMVARHIADRFGLNPNFKTAAGDEVVRIAEFCGEHGMPDTRRDLYEAFFSLIPDHPMVPSYLMSFGSRHYKEDDFPTAIGYFEQLATYTNSPLSLDALNIISTIYNKTDQATNEVAALDEYIARLQARPKPGHAYVSAVFRQAQARKNYAISILRGSTNDVETAEANRQLVACASAFNNVAKLLKDADNPYQENDQEREQNIALREASLYNKAYCFAQMTLPAEKITALRKAAIAAYEELVATYPQSKFAPPALIQVGAIWTGLSKDDKSLTENAEKALTRLRKEYPDSDEAKNALPLQAKNLMEMGLRNDAVAIYAQMFKETGKYTNLDILKAGQALVDAKEYDIASQAFERILSSGDTTLAVVAPARLGEAKILLRRGRFDEALAKIDSFIKDYGNTSLKVDALLLKVDAASEAGMREKDDKRRNELFNDAVQAIKDVKPYRTTELEKAEDDLETGRLLIRRAKAEEAFGKPEKAQDTRGKAIVAYLMMIMNVPASNIALAPAIEQAYKECIALMVENETWEDAADKCREYLQDFPRGRFVADVQGWLNACNVHLGNTSSAPAPAAEQ